MLSYIKSEFTIDALECSCISSNVSSVKSFKVTVLASQTELLLNPVKWPVNVVIRKFYNSRKLNVNHGS